MEKRKLELVSRAPAVGVGTLYRMLGSLGWKIRAYFHPAHSVSH
jgi:hypothetical protein